jgi:hypothetical protein
VVVLLALQNEKEEVVVAGKFLLVTKLTHAILAEFFRRHRPRERSL